MYVSTLFNILSSANQFVFLSKSICFPQQINLFSSANQFVFLGKSICFAEKSIFHIGVNHYISYYYTPSETPWQIAYKIGKQPAVDGYASR